MQLIVRQTKFKINAVLSNLQFCKMKEGAMKVFSNAFGKILIENCTFVLNRLGDFNSMIMIGMDAFNSTLTFLNCIFDQNSGEKSLIGIAAYTLQSNSNHTNCLATSTIILERCNFIRNVGTLVEINFDTNTLCTLNLIIVGPCSITENIAIISKHLIIYNSDIIYTENVAIKMIGPVSVSHNEALNIIDCRFCDILFSEDIVFTSNHCYGSVIHIFSLDAAYLKVMEGTNITFSNNTVISNAIIYFKSYNYHGPYVFCGIQYVAFNSTKTSTVLTKHYIINFYNNFFQFDEQERLPCELYFHQLTTHCRWILTSVFHGHDPGMINQQIIQTDQHQLSYHTTICYCSHNITNCGVDVLGPVYPGQVLQVEFCIPNSDKPTVLYVEAHSTQLPTSACKIAHQTELIQTVTTHSAIFNFTIVIKNNIKEMCEIFLTVSPCLYQIYEAFFVEILPCPVGFTLQDGVCNCDPYLRDSNLHIDTCYIDQSAITRPANAWVTAYNYSNHIKFLISHNCPMDYCLPHSSRLNLLNPDLQCQFNRTGILCSQCQHSLSMVFGSSRCIHCTNVHILITFVIIVAGAVLVVLLYLLNLTVTTGTINGIIFYANIISINDSVFLVNDNIFQPLKLFISFSNLDLGIETCFYNGMNGFVKMFLQLFFPFYLIIIAFSIIIGSRYSSTILRWTYTRSLPVLATLFLLSYTSVLRAVLTVLFSYSTITQLPSGHQQVVWSIDASVPLFSLKFIILFITCLVLFLLLIPFNLILLFTRCLSQFRMINYFKPLLDAFQGSYKNKYHYWIGVLILLRSMFFIFYALNAKLKLVLSTVLLISFSILVGYIHPSRNQLVNIQELLLLLNLTILYAVCSHVSGSMFSTVTNVMISLAFIQFCTIVFYHFLTYTCHCCCIV